MTGNLNTKPNSAPELQTFPALVPPSLRATPSSFYWAMRMLPRPEREAIFEVYSFCRVVDDIADGDLPLDEKIELLNDWQRRIDDIINGTEAATVADGLSTAITSYGIDRDDLFAVISGMKTDSVEKVAIANMDELDIYMDRVASAVGKISNKVFGLKGSQADSLAVNLGRALQLTNILRDIAEDASLGRTYIPRSVLEKFSIQKTESVDILKDENLPAALGFMAALAQEYYQKAGENLMALPRGPARPPRIMKAVYERVLKKMINNGWRYPYATVRISKIEKIFIAARAAFFA
ncbi:MAG: squalene/phytoene synthase family protein [Rhodospirillaceae bacterium]|nr:squalene/phytoene synthase family protein [Rhodospirillaceae bacterium]